MRMLQLGVLTAIVFAYLSTVYADKYDDLVDGADDQHGNLSWVSSAAEVQTGVRWKFWQKVTNHNQDYACRVRWDAVHFDQNVPPTLTVETKPNALPGRPREVDRPIFYNGTPQPGEGKKDTRAWVENDPDEKFREALEPSAEIAVEYDGKFYLMKVEGVAKVKGDQKEVPTMAYDLTIRNWTPENRTEKIKVSNDIRYLLNHVNVEWESISSPVWDQMPPAEFRFGWIKEGRFIQFDKTDSEMGVFRFQVELHARHGVSYQSKTLRFLDPNKTGDEAVLAKVWFPGFAIGPAK